MFAAQTSYWKHSLGNLREEEEEDKENTSIMNNNDSNKFILK